MNLSPYEAFVKTAEEGSLTKAAEALGYTQSGITHMLDSLEKQLDMRLLVRSRAGVQLTSEGIQVLPYIQEILSRQHLLEEKVRDMKGLSGGLLRIGTFTSVSSQWLPGMIRQFRGKYPDIAFELRHGTNNENENWVRSGRVDFAFVRLPASSDLCTVELLEDPIVGVAAAGSRWAEKNTLPLRELPSMPYISLSEGVEDEITDLLKQNHLQIRPSFVEKDDYAVIAMVEQNLGVSIMPALVLRNSNRKVRLLKLDPPASRRLGIAYRSEETLSPAAGKFIQSAAAWIQKEKKKQA
jgi:DNA-binding transcriptional LysR family regulator